MSILLYKKWSKKVEILARGLIWVLIEYPKTLPPRAPPKVRARAPKGLPTEVEAGGLSTISQNIKWYVNSSVFNLLRISKMIYICFFCTLRSLPPPTRVPTSLRARAPKGCLRGGGEREAGYYFKKYQMIFQFLGLQLWSPFALRVPSEPPPQSTPGGKGSWVLFHKIKDMFGFSI